MSSTASQPAPKARTYATTFIVLNADLPGEAAVQRLLLAKKRRVTHAIVRRVVDHGATYFYLFDTISLVHRLRRSHKQAWQRLSVKEVLDLRESGQSPTVTELETPVAGAVVVRDDQAVGFIPVQDTVLAMPPAQSDVILDTLIASTVDHFIATEGDPHRTIDELFQLQINTDRRNTRYLPPPFWLSDSIGFGEGNKSFDVSAGRTSVFPDPVDFAVRADPFPDSSAESGSSAGAEPNEDAPPSSASPRYFNARTPDRVALNAQTYVIVHVAGEAAQPSVDSAAGNAPIGDFIGTLTIDVHAPGLRANGPTTLTLEVPVSGDSAMLRFGFVAHKAGLQQIAVMAWNGSAQVAGVTLQIAVEMEAVASDRNESRDDMDMREPEIGEYTLDVAMEPDTRRYRFQLRSDQKDVWPPMYSEPLLNARQQTFERTIASLNAQARNLYGLKTEDQAIWLRGIGNLLFDQLVPDKLKALLIERKSKIRLLNILSDADPTPWELLFLADPDTGDGDFLGASTTVARWRYGAGPSRSLKRANKVLVLPTDAPPQAKAELQSLQSLLGGADTIGDLSSLNTLMATGGFDLLHFAAHNVNVPNVQGGAYVPFGTQRWDLTFMASVPRNKFKSRSPLIFMNACTTSGTTEFYTEVASWADRFLICGSGAFIGTLWEVRDSSARQFSETFYNELLQGQTLGAAMQTARTKLRDINPGDPTPLAYTLYGNPLARLEQS